MDLESKRDALWDNCLDRKVSKAEGGLRVVERSIC